MNILSKIKPVPQRATLGNGRVILSTGATPDFRISLKSSCNTLETIICRLYIGLSGKCNTDAKSADGKTEIILEISSDIPDEITKNSDQAYSMSVEENKITLTGYGEAGLRYAITTFLQCIETENNTVFIRRMNILDWPDLKTRGHFVECRFGSNLMTLDDWKEVVDDMVSMKMNQLAVALYGCWCIQYDKIRSEYLYIPIPQYPKLKSDVIKHYYSPSKKCWIKETVEVPMVREDFFGELIAYGKEQGVEVLPLWNSYGHNSLLPKNYPEVAPVIDGKPAKNSLCVSSPKTYEMLFNIFDYIIDKYLKPNGIESFHIGMDEVRNETGIDIDDMFTAFSPWCECEGCSKLRNEEKFINHALKLIKHLKSRGMKNIYIYCDMIERIMDPNNFKKMLEENDLLDVTVIDWWTYRNQKENLRFKTTFPELGMRTVVKPHNSYFHWNTSRDTVGNVYYLCEMAKNENVEGLQSYCGWDRTNDKNHVSMADYSWNFDGTGSMQEFNERYAWREFGARYDEAIKALRLFDKVTEEENTTQIGDNDITGNGYMFQRSFAYYFYTYIAKDRPYPRNYPGEAMDLLLSDRELYVRHLKEISSLSAEAAAIFDSLAKDSRCNTYLARRFACEMRSYNAIASDFLALLEIHDLIEAKNGNCSIAAEISSIAAARKNSRLELMLEMECVKESYLTPSHLRNQSIYMQIFSDIEAYVSNTPDNELQFDIRDLRNIGSPAFYNLR
ncbi:MAG: family 20 glycosylhydrolase [Oscillospiraceae bacterium]|nr:family 20 glycosylhydrolase [Oscillospiraceae bacterium]